MSYFPAFIQLDGKKVLLVGGGNIAYEKLEKLLHFTQDILIISPKFSNEMRAEIQKKNLNFKERNYEVGDIKEFSMVIVAVDSIELQKQIFIESKNYNCLCNSVDSVEYCDFIFPSFIKKDDLTLAISTSGSSPAFAKHFKKYLSNLIPEGISEFLKEMKTLRQTLPKGKERMKILDEKANDYVSKL